MKFRYITIEREYGSGGTKIARRLSEVSGVPCYGREILEAVAKKQGIPVERINQYEEKATGSLIYSMFIMSRVQTGDPNMLTKEGKVFLDEQLEIRRLAMEGPAIFLGHCASDALRDQKGVIKVFIHSENEEEVKNRIAKDYGIAPGDVESTRRFYNKKRAGYFRANTGNEWKDLKNYDVVLDSAKLGIEGCVNILKGIFE
ncbi:cytidylate kinase-like family protein [Mediterraneibacter glycyrrhizinilyticus]|uniref:cytidylate kinase-like family protein n=1 Tax=Mediterraneibacter glycyrrhizinilyticus TaxID=342942 RepID=UPI0025AA9B97|nr:cytidylate kinase-like family protein [Mediterraneibacter glycyrrhizinilyticus]MDN0062673.1 cytidylate kinase-like family protein [Mediterraneibacter glycyrrhizinilyticus]